VQCYLEHYAPKDVLALLDLNTLELDNTEYVAESFKSLFADIIWKTKGKERDTLIIILFEHKIRFEKEAIVQLLLYIACIWRLDTLNKRPLKGVLPIIICQGGTNEAEHYLHELLEHFPQSLRKWMPNMPCLVTNMRKLLIDNILALPPNNLLRSLFLIGKCGKSNNKLMRYFSEIFRFQETEPHLEDFVKILLEYLVEISELTAEQWDQLIREANSFKSKRNVMSTYEMIKRQGGAEARKLRDLTILWRLHLLDESVEYIEEILNMDIPIIKKWLKHFTFLQQAEKDGLTVEAMMDKVNVGEVKPILTAEDILELLAFFKMPPPVAKKKRKG
jgi:Putative transposase, YhgA-like